VDVAGPVRRAGRFAVREHQQIDRRAEEARDQQQGQERSGVDRREFPHHLSPEESAREEGDAVGHVIIRHGLGAPPSGNDVEDGVKTAQVESGPDDPSEELDPEDIERRAGKEPEHGKEGHHRAGPAEDLHRAHRVGFAAPDRHHVDHREVDRHRQDAVGQIRKTEVVQHVDGEIGSRQVRGERDGSHEKDQPPEAGVPHHVVETVERVGRQRLFRNARFKETGEPAPGDETAQGREKEYQREPEGRFFSAEEQDHAGRQIGPDHDQPRPTVPPPDVSGPLRGGQVFRQEAVPHRDRHSSHGGVEDGQPDQDRESGSFRSEREGRHSHQCDRLHQHHAGQHVLAAAQGMDDPADAALGQRPDEGGPGGQPTDLSRRGLEHQRERDQIRIDDPQHDGHEDAVPHGDAQALFNGLSGDGRMLHRSVAVVEDG